MTDELDISRSRLSIAYDYLSKFRIVVLILLFGFFFLGIIVQLSVFMHINVFEIGLWTYYENQILNKELANQTNSYLLVGNITVYTLMCLVLERKLKSIFR
jgi:heme/copper-type cytochrome/quinol oxidase subunit 4